MHGVHAPTFYDTQYLSDRYGDLEIDYEFGKKEARQVNI